MRLSDLQKRVIGTRPDLRFIATFDTTLTSVGSSASNQIALPLLSSGGTYNFNVEWGDGSSDVITSGTQLERTHTYATSGVYEIKISGLCRGFRFANTGDRLKILEIKNWGTSIEYLSNTNANLGVYRGCSNLDFTATDKPILLGSIAGFFRDCTNLIGNNSINNWDVSNSTSFIGVFNVSTIGSSKFNQPIGNWDVSNATTFGQMFSGNTVFNQNIGNWDVGNATNFIRMFRQAFAFNNGGSDSINNWNVSKGTNFSFMFEAATSFNQPIGNWNVSNAINMENMFENFAPNVFNQEINNWNVSKVTNMNNMFRALSMFAKSLSDWKLNSSVTMTSMLNVSNTTIGTNLQEWYSRTLIGWANDVFARGGVPSGRSLGANNRRYNNTAYTTGLQFNDAVSARAYLVNTAGWTISGDAQI
jgi:surface protein